MTIVLSVMSGLILVGSAFTAFMLYYVERRDNVIKVKMDESGMSSVEFRAINIAPGDTREYLVKLTSELEGPCTLSLDFQELSLEEPAAPLKEYVYVTVKVNETILCDGLLKDIYDLPAIQMDCTLDGKEPFVFEITYHMPESVGNEAQNAKASFDLALTASNE